MKKVCLICRVPIINPTTHQILDDFGLWVLDGLRKKIYYVADNYSKEELANDFLDENPDISDCILDFEEID